MLIKHGVRIFGVRPEITLALHIADGIYKEHKAECVVTSVIDGKHSSGSLHYVGQAVDLRINNLPEGAPAVVKRELQRALGADFDVILERDHIHVEFQPKSPY